MSRTAFLVDGFNLYHSLVDASQDAGGASTKWLDVRKLCDSYLAIVGRTAGDRAELAQVYYFSAPPKHSTQDKVRRHSLYMSCLRATGINVVLGRFKRKEVYCSRCNKYFLAHEEKETDVAIAVKLLEICFLDEADNLVLVTGDTDLAPAVRTCRNLFPGKLIFFAFPYKRTNRELAAIAPESFAIKRKSYLRHRFPNPLVLPNGSQVQKPSAW